jgi:hypothetical protein
VTQANDGYQNSRDVWKDYNHRQEFEHDLINRKTTWGLTSQTILFAAYGVTLRGNNTPGKKDLVAIGYDFRKVVISAGLLIAVVTFVAVLATVNSKRLSWRQYEDFYEGHAYLQEQLVKRRSSGVRQTLSRHCHSRLFYHLYSLAHGCTF